MADIVAYIAAGLSLTSQLTNPLANPDVASESQGPTTMTTAPVPFIPGSFLIAKAGSPGIPSVTNATSEAVLPITFGDFWFEMFHVLPREIALGNILTPLSRTIDIFSAFRHTSHDLNNVVNNAGTGVTFANLPSLPYTFFGLTGLELEVDISTSGPATINATIDFIFDTGTDSVPISGIRIVMFPFEPEAPVVEHLEFLTAVLPHLDGTEQRIANRLAPRQSYEMLYRREAGRERQLIDMLLFEWQDKVFGLPVWVEPSFLTGDVLAGATSVNVDDTSFGDFRVGGLCIVFDNEDRFDAVEIASMSSSVINFSTPVVNAYSAGVRVMPLRLAITKQVVSEKRYAKNLADYSMTMCVLDNDVNLGSVAGWPVYNSKVLLDEPNQIDTTLDGTLDHNLVLFDGDTGKFSQASTWDRSRRASAKGFFCRTRARLWAIRTLFHALQGRQVSFYLPTFSEEITLAAVYTSGNPAISIDNVGYTKYAQQRQPRDVIRIVLINGTTFTRTVTNSSDAGATETLTLSATIGQNINPSDVERIEYLEKVRMDADNIVLRHNDSNGNCDIGVPVKVVFD